MIHKISFKYAWDGIMYAFTSQPNLRFHGMFAVLVTLSGWYFQLTRFEWLTVIFTVLLMFTAEMVNTALESMTDLITIEYRNQAKLAKDTSAGMVLLNAIGSVIIGIIIFGPHITALFWK